MSRDQAQCTKQRYIKHTVTNTGKELKCMNVHDHERMKGPKVGSKAGRTKQQDI